MTPPTLAGRNKKYTLMNMSGVSRLREKNVSVFSLEKSKVSRGAVPNNKTPALHHLRNLNAQKTSP